MSDQLLINDGKITVTTEEGTRLERDECELERMLRRELEPPMGTVAYPDGVKKIEWRPPYCVVVHQLPPHIHKLSWIAADSPAQFGEGTKYRSVSISLPYALTFAVFHRTSHGLGLTGYNELYFRNSPLVDLGDGLGFPALLNISAVRTPSRTRSWICTQYLRIPPGSLWTKQLEQLLEHTWNGSFNLSSEHHEGASHYTASQGVHPALHPIERWEEETKRDPRFALEVPWRPVGLTVAQVIDALIAEVHEHGPMAVGLQSPFGRSRRVPSAPASIAKRFMSYAQKKTA